MTSPWLQASPVTSVWLIELCNEDSLAPGEDIGLMGLMVGFSVLDLLSTLVGTAFPIGRIPEDLSAA